MTTAVRFVDGDPITHAVDEDHPFHGRTRCGLRIEWFFGRTWLEPRDRQFGHRVGDPVDCMTCLARG